MKEYTHLAQFFLTHFVFLDFAIPTIILSVEKEHNIAHLNGTMNWIAHIRERPWLWIQEQHPNSVYYHPIKWAYLDRGSRNHTAFFCKMVDYIYSKYAEFL